MSWRPQPKGSRKPEKRRFQNKGLRFFSRHFRGLHKTASNSSVGTLEIFAGPRAPQKCLLGSSPNPLDFWTLCPEVPVVCVPELSLLGLIFPPVRVAEQVIDIRLDRNSLPHIRLGLAVFSIKGFFLFGEFPALLFQRVHFRELRAA